MKAERRHELQTNSLALWLRWRAPQLAQQHGNKILIGVIILALAIVLIRYRINAPRAAAASATQSISVARTFIDELSQARRTPGDAAQALRLITQALESSDNPNVQAQGYLALGDYYWALVCWPVLPQAATQPTLRPEWSREELLDKTGEAYQKVMDIPDQPPHIKAAAQMGLAAVAEQRAFDASRAGKNDDALWQAARERYEAVATSDSAPAVIRDEAKWHLDKLPQLQQPLWFAPVTQPSATTQSSSDFTNLVPSTQPLERPAPIVPTPPTTAPSTPSTQPTR